MSDYTKLTNFAAKDALATGNASKRVKGSEIDTEFNNIAIAVATKANSASPTFSGTVTAAALTASGLLTVSGNRITVSNATTPMLELHVPGVIAAALSTASGESLRLNVTNGSGALSTKLLSVTNVGNLTAPLQAAAQAYIGSSQTSGTTVIFGTETKDNQAAYNNATGVFTAPVSGVYAVSANVKTFNNNGTSQGVTFTLSVSGTAFGGCTLNIDAFSVESAIVTGFVTVTAGQTISIVKSSAFTANIYTQADTDAALSIVLLS